MMSIPADKLLHALAGAALAVIGTAITATPLGGFALATLGGAFKEILDSYTHEADWMDFVATVAGGAVVAGLISLAGCTTVDMTYRDARFDRLVTIERYVPEAEMRDRCSKYTGPLSSPMACAEWDFDAGTCTIWYSSDFPPTASIVEHERRHCQGYIRHG